MDLLRFLSSTQLTNQFLARVAYFVASHAHVLIRDSSDTFLRVTKQKNACVGGSSVWPSVQPMGNGNDIDRNYHPKLSADKLPSIGLHSTDTFAGQLSVACRSSTA